MLKKNGKYYKYKSNKIFICNRFCKDSDKPNAMDVYEFLWRGRDFELSHLWQRSVFLGAFLLGIASVYSVYFKDIFLEQFKTTNPSTTKCYKLCIFGVVPIVITIIGIIFSELWIMMAKGSKMWYEIYEDSISKVSKSTNFWGNVSIKIFDEDEEKEREIIDELKFGRLFRNPSTSRSDCLFSTAGGSFSVSKINVMIGIVFLILFGFLFLGHIIWTVFLLLNNCPSLTILDRVFLCLNFFRAVIICFVCSYYIKKKVSSSYWG